MKTTKEVALAAVKHNDRLLLHVPDELKADKEVALLACRGKNPTRLN